MKDKLLAVAYALVASAVAAFLLMVIVADVPPAHRPPRIVLQVVLLAVSVSAAVGTVRLYWPGPPKPYTKAKPPESPAATFGTYYGAPAAPKEAAKAPSPAASVPPPTDSDAPGAARRQAARAAQKGPATELERQEAKLKQIREEAAAEREARAEAQRKAWAEEQEAQRIKDVKAKIAAESADLERLKESPIEPLLPSYGVARRPVIRAARPSPPPLPVQEAPAERAEPPPLPPAPEPVPSGPGQASALIGTRLAGESLGTVLEHDDELPVVALFADHLPDLARQQFPEADFSPPEADGPGEVRAGPDALARHCFIAGGVGTGKTRLLVQLVVEQIKAGCSAILVDPKEETLAHVYELALASGLPKERVDLLLPSLGKETRCCFDPFAGKPATFASILQGIVGGWGPRMGDLLVNALTVLKRVDGTPLELVRFLQDEDYREHVLREVAPLAERDLELEAALDFFRDEFGAWPAGQQVQAVSPVLNKLRDFVRNPFLLYAMAGRGEGTPLFDAGNYFSLEPNSNRLGLVYLDREALGDETAKLFAGLIMNHVFFRAMKNDARNSRPCVLCLDEAAISAPFLGKVLKESIILCRSMNVRVMTAVQDLSLLDPELRSVLLGQPSVQAYFRLGFADAKVVAEEFAAKAEERVEKVVYGRGKGKRPEATLRLWLRWKANGEPVTAADYSKFAAIKTHAWDDRHQREYLKDRGHLFDLHHPGTGETYSLEAARNRFPLPERIEFDRAGAEARFAAGTGTKSPGHMMGNAFFDVPLPRPEAKADRSSKADVRERWTKDLCGIPVGTAVVKIASQGVCRTQIAHVPDPVEAARAFGSHPMPQGGAEAVERAVLARKAKIKEAGGGGDHEPEAPKRPFGKQEKDGDKNDKPAGGNDNYGSVSADDPGL